MPHASLTRTSSIKRLKSLTAQLMKREGVEVGLPHLESVLFRTLEAGFLLSRLRTSIAGCCAVDYRGKSPPRQGLRVYEVGKGQDDIPCFRDCGRKHSRVCDLRAGLTEEYESRHTEEQERQEAQHPQAVSWCRKAAQ